MKKFVWNQFKNGCINLEKVRNFSLTIVSGGVDVLAWFSDKETLRIGNFDSEVEAKTFLERLLEEKK